MNRQAHKCKVCRQSFTAVKIDQKYCSHKCRQAAYRRRLARHAKQLTETTTPALIPTTCAHCVGSFWAKTDRARFCSTSCRTLYHRALKAALPAAIQTIYGLPEEKAVDLVETQSIGKLRRLLEGAGCHYRHAERRWVQLS